MTTEYHIPKPEQLELFNNHFDEILSALVKEITELEELIKVEGERNDN
jgi:hypothetical protein